MSRRRRALARASVVALVVVAACSAKRAAPVGDDGVIVPDPGTPDASYDDVIHFDAQQLQPGCRGLGSAVPSCSGKAKTTITGTVYDPAGRTPLYGVYVYIPDCKLDPLASGATCSSCQAPASGSPLEGGVLTDATGHFELVDVPAGKNVPLVMQLGKFRRAITIPSVDACVENAIGKKDAKGRESLTRMPRKHQEGSPDDNVPRIAMATGGCDNLECLMRKIGIDDAEFGPTGRVQLFTGQQGATGPGSSDAYAFWANRPELEKYDIVVNSCECAPFDRSAAGYQAMREYLNGGGRMFGTHYHYNWFAPPTGPADFQSVAHFTTDGTAISPEAGPPVFYINTTIPKGAAFSDWIQHVFAASGPPPKGQIGVTYAANDVAEVKGTTTNWIYTGNADFRHFPYETVYLSFNTPVGAKVQDQCGRAVFSDLHVSSGGTPGGVFPGECGDADVPLTQQETALEFLFFDLSSCVGDDTKAPPSPPPK